MVLLVLPLEPTLILLALLIWLLILNVTNIVHVFFIFINFPTPSYIFPLIPVALSLIKFNLFIANPVELLLLFSVSRQVPQIL